MTREERENALHCLKVMIDEEVCEECNLYGTTGTDHCEADCVRVAIKALEQESKVGQWREDIDNNRRWDRVRFYCSECGDWQTYGKSHYCPNCGCRMVEPQENEG